MDRINRIADELKRRLIILLILENPVNPVQLPTDGYGLSV